MEQNVQSNGSRGTIVRWVRKGLASKLIPVAVAVLAVALTLPSLGVGLIGDDYIHQMSIQGPPEDSCVARFFAGSPMDIFRFLKGDSQEVYQMMDLGVLPWWAFEGIQGSFWRPVTALTHRLDYYLWPKHPALMHAQSLFWFAALVAAVALLYRQLMGATWVAGLAGLLYAIDDAHGLPAGWLANRNALLATLFGVLTLLVHHRQRSSGERGWRWGAILGPLLLLLSLFSAEAGIATCAYLFAYALFVDCGSRRRRFLSLIPYAFVVFAWRWAWAHMGYGVSGLGLYVDPINEPLRFLVTALQRAPILLLGQWALPPADLTMVFGPGGLWRYSLGASVFILLLFVVLVPLLRRDRLARFWALGMLLSAIPICASFPSDRLLMFVGIGAMGLVAQFFDLVFGRPDRRPIGTAWRTGAITFGCIFMLVHLVIAPIGLPIRAGFLAGQKRLWELPPCQPPLDHTVEHQDVVIVNAPSCLHTAYLPIVRKIWGQPVPRRTRALAPTLFPVAVHRPDERSLVVRPRDGFIAMTINQLFRSERRPMVLGQKIELTGMSVEVTALTDDGRPAEALFRFAVPLEDTSLRWLQWQDYQFVPFTPPAVGESIEVRPNLPGYFRLFGCD